MTLKITFLTPKFRLSWTISTLNMIALATFLRGVARIYKPYSYTPCLCLVTDKSRCASFRLFEKPEPGAARNWAKLQPCNLRRWAFFILALPRIFVRSSNAIVAPEPTDCTRRVDEAHGRNPSETVSGDQTTFSSVVWRFLCAMEL